MEIWSREEEAHRLKERFATVTNKARFARFFDVPGGAPTIYLHSTGRSPISLKAGRAYAKGFGVPLHEISPRLAMEEQKLQEELTPDAPTYDPAGPIAQETIRRALVAIEEVLNEMQMQLPPYKKAEALIMACQILSSTPAMDGKTVVQSLMKLAA